MAVNIPEKPTPDWLLKLSPDEIGNEEFPLKLLLKDSFYYPCSGLDGRPVQFLGNMFHSFVYVDYGMTEDRLDNEIKSNGFIGYNIVGKRSVTKDEIVPPNWAPHVLPDESERLKLRARQSWMKDPFISWIVFERSDDVDSSHGPKRFSLLYICADGATTYQALYSEFTPRGVAIIQPGTGFGGNYTDYTDPERLFGRSVRGTGDEVPEYLFNGGIGYRHFYNDSIWPDNFSEDLGWVCNQPIHIWGRKKKEFELPHSK